MSLRCPILSEKILIGKRVQENWKPMEEKVAEGPKQVGRDLEAKISFYSLQVEISFGETKLPCPRTRWVVSTL